MTISSIWCTCSVKPRNFGGKYRLQFFLPIMNLINKEEFRL